MSENAFVTQSQWQNEHKIKINYDKHVHLSISQEYLS